MNKRGLSTVVETVLLILISFIAIGVISAYVLPMIRGGLGEGQSCFDVRDYVKVSDSESTCYDTESTTLLIERGFEDTELKSITISIYSDSLKSSQSFEIKETVTEGVTMYDSTTEEYSLTPVIPARGEGKTYKFSIPSGVQAEVGVVLKDGTLCQSSSSTIKQCNSL